MRSRIKNLNHKSLDSFETSLLKLFKYWFNPSFLVLEKIDWSTPASILEKIIAYEAVQAINSWDDLRARLAPSDRKCFAFFHPLIPDEPLIFVEVALCKKVPESILEKINLNADNSKKGVSESLGLMVNYLYDLDIVEKNHELFFKTKEVKVSHEIKSLNKAL